MKQIIPSDWIPVEKLIEINVDDDAENEWLLFYRYDLSAESREKKNFASPIGGLVFDQQVDRTTGISVLTQHALLPDIKDGKGQGFLGEKSCEVKTYDTSGDGYPDSGELAVFGAGYGPSTPVYLSIFKRQADQTFGYNFQLIRHFYGDGGIIVEPAADKPSALQMITVKTRLNDRSLLSKSTVFKRQTDEAGIVQYEQDKGRSSLQFTYGIPENPYYPEAAVLAYYLWMSAGNKAEANRFLLPQEQQGTYLQRVQQAGFPVTAPVTPAWGEGEIRLLSLSYSSASEILIDPGQVPIYYSTVTVQESTGDGKVWDVIGLLDGRCGTEICWQLMSWQ